MIVNSSIYGCLLFSLFFRFTMRAAVMAKSLNNRSLPCMRCLLCFHSLIASSSTHKMRETRLINALMYCSPELCQVTLKKIEPL